MNTNIVNNKNIIERWFANVSEIFFEECEVTIHSNTDCIVIDTFEKFKEFGSKIYSMIGRNDNTEMIDFIIDNITDLN